MRYSDPTGLWTEDELRAALGDDWAEGYFGQGAVFEGRDQLLEFLQSEDQRNLVNLFWVAQLFSEAQVDAPVIKATQPDAVGYRATVGGALIPPIVVGGDASVDIVLNLTAGQLSYFVSAGSGLSVGAGLDAAIGKTAMWYLPTNDAYRGWAESLGGSATFGIGAGLEFFCAPPDGKLFVVDPSAAVEGMSGVAYAVGVGARAGAYDIANVAYEVYRGDARGGAWPNIWQQIDALRVGNAR